MIDRQLINRLQIHTDLPQHHDIYQVLFLIIIITTLFTPMYK